MKSGKKLLILIVIIVLIINTCQNNIYAEVKQLNEGVKINAAVFLYNFQDQYMSLVKQSLEDIQRENEGKVQFTFFDAKGNQTIQNESIDGALNENYNLFVINFVITKVDVMNETLYKVKQKDIPFILYTEPEGNIAKVISNPNKSLFLASNIEQSGILEGRIIVDKWNNNKEEIDRNRDNKIQYVMLRGKYDSPIAAARTEYSISTINKAGIATEQLAVVNCDWMQDLARNAMESLFLRYGDRIEAVISNNDAMAIGAIKALQKYGYNKGDKTKNISVVGIDAIPEARDLIQKGFMTGTVIQDPRATAEAIFTIGMNMVNNMPPLENTKYKFDETGIVVRLPYEEYR